VSNNYANDNWNPQSGGSVSGVYDFGQYNYPTYRPSTTKRTVTTTYEYDKNGKVIKQTVVEETVTTSSDYYRGWNPYTPVYCNTSMAL
jgi:hypothetical protein